MKKGGAQKPSINVLEICLNVHIPVSKVFSEKQKISG